MRSHNFARAVLRTAARSTCSTAQRSLSRQVTPSFGLPLITTASTSRSIPRLFSSTSVDLKKKHKKNAFAAAEEDASETTVQDDELAIEDDDDLFGSISDSSAAASTTVSSPASSMSRAEFAHALEQYSSALEWSSLDRGQFPSLHRWRFLAGHAKTLPELESVLSLARLYRDRVSSLGVESGYRFAARASAIRLPEVGLNAFLDRYTTGLEYDQEALYLVQSGLRSKLGRRNRQEILQSLEIQGAPVQQSDLLGVLTSESAETEREGEVKEAEDGKAKAIEKKYELDMPLARAQLSIIDRMAILASLSPSDPILLSFLPHAYIRTFNLTSRKSARNPLLANIYTRTDALISLLTTTAQHSLVNSAKPNPLPDRRSIKLFTNLNSTLSYVALRGQAKFVDPLEGKQLDPVRTLYRFMDRVGPSQSNTLVRKVEPLLQSYGSL